VETQPERGADGVLVGAILAGAAVVYLRGQKGAGSS
jgi:hypothetical protein